MESEDIVGKHFFDWEVLSLCEKRDSSGNKLYECRCKCGIIKIKTKNAVSSGNSKRCISCSNEKTIQDKLETKRKKYIGKVYGTWTIKDYSRKNNKCFFIVECVCGNQKKDSSLASIRRFLNGCFKCRKTKLTNEQLLKRRKNHIEKAKEKIGKDVGSFKILKIAYVKNSLIHFVCKCFFCKKNTIIPNGSIPFRESCGCLREKHKARGSKQHASKLNEIEAASIRDLYESGYFSLTELSKQFEVTIGTISAIIKKETWKHV
jgi:hypothetical protein